MRTKIQKQFAFVGFTMIEMLVVVAVIGLVSSIILVNARSVRAKARDAQRVQELGGMQNVLEMYYMDQGSYPFWPPSSPGSDDGVCIESLDAADLADALSEYYPSLPGDPLYDPAKCTSPASPDCYCFVYRTAGPQQYKLFARMEKMLNLALEDRGTYDDYYELFSISDIPESSQIVFPVLPGSIASNPSSGAYGNVEMGLFSDVVFTVSNPGPGFLDVFAVSITGADAGDFSIQSGDLPFSLDVGQSHEIAVRFAPTMSTGDKTATLQLDNNLADPSQNPFFVPLAGLALIINQAEAVWEDTVGTRYGPVFASTSTPSQ